MKNTNFVRRGTFTQLAEVNMHAIHPETGRVIGNIQAISYQYTKDEDNNIIKGIAGNIVFNTVEFSQDEPFTIVINDFNNKNIVIIKNSYVLAEQDNDTAIETEHSYVFVANEIEESDYDEQKDDK